MWTRSELKARGKAAFKANTFNCILVALILAVMFGSSTAGGGGSAYNSVSNGSDFSTSLMNVWDGLSSQARVGMSAAVLGITTSVGLLGILLTFFVFNPLEVSCRRFFFLNSYSPANLDELKYSFSEGRFQGVVKTMFFKDLYLFLWYLCFIIPGLVKSYSYKMVPYILAEDPFIDYKDAINLSREMMNGHKWRAFVLDLSFIGWYLLSALTLGILHIFYVGPYTCVTDAELYRTLRQQYVVAPDQA